MKKRWYFFWHVTANEVTCAHWDEMCVLAETEHEAIENAFTRLSQEFDYDISCVDFYDLHTAK